MYAGWGGGGDSRWANAVGASWKGGVAGRAMRSVLGAVHARNNKSD